MRKEAVKAPSNPKGHQRKSEEFPEEGVPFFKPGKRTVSSPRLPRNPPQLHHDLPPRNTPKTQKPPIKTTFPPLKLFCKQKPEK
jgi:hypothetical protein